MEIEHIREFHVFSQYMNFTHAADSLHLSQSNLSKHIKQLEAELGCDLVKRGAKCHLTPIGDYFLRKTGLILNEYDSLRKKCIEMKSGGQFRFQDPPAPDEAGSLYYVLTERFRQKHPNVTVHFTRIWNSDVESSLKERKTNLALLYEYGSIDEIEERYRKKGFLTKHLATESAVVYCEKTSRIAEKDFLLAKDLKNVPILIQSKQYDPFIRALIGLCESHGFTPNFRSCKADLYSDFILLDNLDGVIITLEQLTNDRRFSIKENRRFIPFAKHEADFQVFAIMAKPDSDSEDLLADFLSEETMV